jgi:hypothetical protein
MFDCNRYKGVLQFALVLTLSLLAVELGLSWAAGPEPGWLIPEHIPMGWDEVEGNESRVSAAGLQCERKAGVSSKELVVFLGKSTLRHGIEPAIFNANDRFGMSYMVIWGQGEGVQDLLLLARPFFHSSLTPKLVVIGIHPAYLVGRLTAPASPRLNPFSAIARREWAEASEAFVRCCWITEQRTNISHLVRGTMFRARERIFDECHLNADAFCAPVADPWLPQYPVLPQSRDDDDAISLRMRRFEEFGWFDQRHYDEYGPQMSLLLVQLVYGFQCRGSQVVIVLMPEEKVIRDRVPQQASSYLTRAIQDALGDSAPAVWDYRSTIPDSEFLDNIHVNDQGRERLSRLLAEAVNQYLEKKYPDLRKRGRGLEP